MKNILRKLEIFVIVVIIAIFGIIYAFTEKPSPTPVSVADQDTTMGAPSMAASVMPDNSPANQLNQPAPSTTITYQGIAGQSALDLLKASHQVQAKHYDFGDQVTSIDGITPDSSHFWAFYVNDQFSQVGASAYITKPTDMIKWEIDALVDTTK